MYWCKKVKGRLGIMSLLNSKNIEAIIGAAEQGLKKQTFGGFSTESTTEALKKVHKV